MQRTHITLKVHNLFSKSTFIKKNETNLTDRHHDTSNVCKNSYSGKTIHNCTTCMKEARLLLFVCFKNGKFTKGMWHKNAEKVKSRPLTYCGSKREIP